MKQYYSCIDSSIPSPQREQHLIIDLYVNHLGGTITYSTSEDAVLRDEQKWIFERVSRISGINGVVFFTVDQFFSSKTFNQELIRKFLISGLEVHFAREQLSFFSEAELDTDNSLSLFIFLFALCNQPSKR